MNGKKRILVIDDERPFADSLVEFFADRGYEARAAYDAEAGRDETEAFDPHVVVTDLRMPGRSGLDLLEDLRSHGDKRIVILVTAHGDLPALWQSMRLHAEGFVRKPLSMEGLARVIEQAVERKRLQIEKGLGI